MRRLFIAPLAFGLVGLVAAAPVAAPKATESKPAAGQHDAFSFPKDTKLSSQQQELLDELRKEYEPKLAEAQARLDKVLTPDHRKVLEEAHKKAVAAGKKGPDARAEALAALKISAEEKSKIVEAYEARNKIMAEIRAKKSALLTDEQKEHMKAAAAKKARTIKN